MLEFFHGKHLEVISSVTKIINNVCIRAFMDIIGQVYYVRAVNEKKLYPANIFGSTNIPTHIQPQSIYFTHNFVPMVPRQIVVPQVNELEGTTTANAIETYDVPCQINHDINEIAVKLNLDYIYVVDSGIVASDGNDDKMNEITEPSDDRTLFVLFFKGYLIF